MRPLRSVAALKNLRSRPLWRLLAGEKAVSVIALLQELLLEGDKALPASVLYERLARALEELRTGGEDLPQTAQAYAADWLSKGFLVRRPLSAGASEELYELSADAAAAIRFVSGLLTRRTLATESRLSSVASRQRANVPSCAR